MKQFNERFGAAVRLLVLLSALLGAGAPEAHAAGGLTFAVASTNAMSGTDVLVPIRASQFSSILTFQFSFHWNPAVATFMSVEAFGLPGMGAGNFGTTMTNLGTLTVSWDDPDGVGKMAADGTVLFGVRLQLLGAAGASTGLTIDGIPTPIEAANDLGDTLAVTITGGQLSVAQPGAAPVIATAPVAQTVTAGNTATFTVSANGPSPLSYQWRFNGADLAGASVSTLTLTNVQNAQAGDYSVVVANSFGSVTSAPVHLTVVTPVDNTPPTITITSPTSNPTLSTSSNSLTLAGVAGDNVGVTQVSWVNNRGGGGTAIGATAWSIPGITLLSGVNVLTVTARDAANNTNTAALTVTYTPQNLPPTISDITDKLVDRNQATADIPFTVSDPETAAAALTLSATSSNPSLVLAANITFGGAGGNRTVRILPEPNQVGTTIITITVSDGSLRASDSFVLTVEHPGLVSHWKFDELAGVAALDSAGANAGTLVNGPLRVPGKIDGALSFDGVDDVVNVPDSNSLDLSNRMTIALWFKPSRLLNSLSGRKDLLKKLNAYWLMIGYPQSDGKLAFVFNSGSPLVKSTTSSWQSNVWCHAVATYDGGQMKLYINGVLESAAATAMPANVNTSPLQIGGNSDFNIFFPGCIDDVRLYNIALSDSDVSSLFQNGVANLPPSLAAIGNKTIDEGSMLTFTAIGADPDGPAQRLTYSLDPDPPVGAGINPNTGIFTWTPTEAQGPSTNTVTIRVTDNGTPALSAFETITIIVNEVNAAPVLAPIASRTILEGVLTAFSVTATDSDLPPQLLTYRLAPGAPEGASVNPVGFFTWTPSEAQGPGIHPITVIVTDNGPGSLSATQSFTLTVLEANNAPTFVSIPDQTAQVLLMLRVTNVVVDTDIPSNHVTFIITDGPKGARINKATGVVSWTPDRTQGPSTNFITVVATDDGVPALSTTNTFRVTVGDFVEMALGSTLIRSGQAGSIPLNLLSTASVTNLSSLLLVSDSRLGSFGLTMLAPELAAGSVLPSGPDTQQLNLGTGAGQSLQGNRLLGELSFVGTSTRSAFVPLVLDNLTAMRQSGAPVQRTIPGAGRVVIIGNEPLLEAVMSTNQQRLLVLYGEPGTGYVVESSFSPTNTGPWQIAWQGSLSNLSVTLQPPGTNGTIYYRAYRQ